MFLQVSSVRQRVVLSLVTINKLSGVVSLCFVLQLHFAHFLLLQHSTISRTAPNSRACPLSGTGKVQCAEAEEQNASEQPLKLIFIDLSWHLAPSY